MNRKDKEKGIKIREYEGEKRRKRKSKDLNEKENVPRK